MLESMLFSVIAAFALVVYLFLFIVLFIHAYWSRVTGKREVEVASSLGWLVPP